jgi:hypothetical protein
LVGVRAGWFIRVPRRPFRTPRWSPSRFDSSGSQTIGQARFGDLGVIAERAEKLRHMASRCVTALWRLGLRRAWLPRIASHGVTLRHSLMALGVMARAPRHDDHFLVLGGEMASVRFAILAVRLAALASSARSLASVRSVIFAVRLAALASSPAVDLGPGGRATRPPGLEPPPYRLWAMPRGARREIPGSPVRLLREHWVVPVVVELPMPAAGRSLGESGLRSKSPDSGRITSGCRHFSARDPVGRPDTSMGS